MTDSNAPTQRPLLEVKHLRKFFPIHKGFFHRHVGDVRAVDDVSFFINEGETLGLVGESGCGKTTASRCVLRAYQPSSGEMLFRTAEDKVVDLAKMSRPELRPLRSQMQMIFQDPYGSLNPRMTLFDIVGEPLLMDGMKNRTEAHRTRGGTARVVWGCALNSCSAFRMRSAAGSGSASASHARSRRVRAWWSPMNRCRRSMCPSRPKS